MSKAEKLIARLRAKPSEVSFGDVKRALEGSGFLEARSNGSHHMFRHPSGRMLTVPKKSGQRVKRYYIEQTLRILEDLDDEST